MEEQVQYTKNEDEDEISLVDLLAVLLKRKVLIIVGTVTVISIALITVIISLRLPPEKSFLPNEYTPKALMLINDASSAGGSLSSLLSSSGLSNIAGIAGVKAGGSTYSALAVYLAGTNSFLDAVVDEFDLINRYKIKEYVRAESRKALKKKLSAQFDEKSGVFSISFTDYDPEFAQRVVNFCVDYMSKRFDTMNLDKNKLEKKNLEENIANTYKEIVRLEEESRRLEQSVSSGNPITNIPSITLEANRIKREIAAQEAVYTQLRTQYELVKIAMASETPVFQVLELAEVPDQKSGPSRGTIMIVISLATFFVFVLLAFVLEAIDNIKKDPETLAKLKGNKS